MTDFKAKMHWILFRLGLRPRPRWRSLQRSISPPSWIWGPLRGRGRGWAEEEEGKGRGEWREGKGGPPSYCWTRAPQSLATPLSLTKVRPKTGPRIATKIKETCEPFSHLESKIFQVKDCKYYFQMDAFAGYIFIIRLVCVASHFQNTAHVNAA